MQVHMDMSVPAQPVADEAEVREALARVCGSAAFANSPRLSRLLTYLVERSLGSDERALHEYAIGIEVFDRGSGFDPQSDTIVRVTARRLRQHLDDYYAGEGAGEALRFRIPKGHYRVLFAHHAASGRPATRGYAAPPQYWYPAMALLVILGLAAAATVWRWWDPPVVKQPLSRTVEESGLSEVDKLVVTLRHRLRYSWDGAELPALERRLRQALAQEPEHIGVLSLLASVYGHDITNGLGHWGDAWSRLGRAADAVLAREPDNAEALQWLGLRAAYQDGDYATAARFYRRALAAAPDSPAVLRRTADFAFLIGRDGRAIELLQASLQRDPLCAGCHYRLAFIYLQVGQYTQAEAHALEYTHMAKGGYYTLAEIYLHQGRLDEAERAAAMQSSTHPWEQLRMQAWLHHFAGRRDAFTRVLRDLESRWPQQAQYRIAQLHALAGDREQALSWLQRSLREGQLRNQPVRLRHPVFHDLRNLDGWQALLRQLRPDEGSLANIEI